MKKLFVIILAALVSGALQGCATEVQDNTGREFRGGWIHIVGNTKIKDMSRAEVQAMFVEVLDSMQSAGCNAVIFQVRPCADAGKVMLPSCVA